MQKILKNQYLNLCLLDWINEFINKSIITVIMQDVENLETYM